MVVFTYLLGCPTRFYKLRSVQFTDFGLSKRTAVLRVLIHRFYSSETSVPPSDSFTPGNEKYKDLQKHFTGRLKATFHHFSISPDYSLVCGLHHDYFSHNDGIYRTNKKSNQPILEQVLSLRQLMVRTDKVETKQKQQWTVQRIRLSPREKCLAASLKCSQGKELRFVVIKLQETKVALNTQLVLLTLDSVFSFEWATDDLLFYTTLNGVRSQSVFRLDLTSGGNQITPVYEETEPNMFVEVALSRDRQMLTINCSGRTRSEVSFIMCDVNASQSEPVVVQPRKQDLLYYVEHWRQRLIILANTGPRQEYQLLWAHMSKPSMTSWLSLFVPDPDTIIKDMDVVGDHCVLLTAASSNEPILIVVPLTDPKEPYVVQLPSWVCAVETKKPTSGDRRGVLEFLISSPVRAPVSCALNPHNGSLLSGGGRGTTAATEAKCITTRLRARGQDGTEVPITLFHTAPVEALEMAPLLVHVYGAYGRDLNMEFSPEKRLLIEHGWALAYCHIRGGGERGLSWHRQARAERKPRGVEDLRECLHFLFSLGVSTPSLTALTAHSAGAVAVGALCNSDPQLMRAVLLQAPFLDVLGSMENPDLPLTVEDREEWGDPLQSSEDRRVLASLCPLQNIKPQSYPSMLLTAYSQDPRIPLSGVVRYANTLKKAIDAHFNCGTQPEHGRLPNVVLDIRPGANHNGPEEYKQMIAEEALKLAFLYAELGLNLPRLSRRRKGL